MRRAKALQTLFPWRYQLFLALAVGLLLPGLFLLPWPEAMMAAFDIAAIAFMVSLISLLEAAPAEMRRAAVYNDANRELMLLITVIVSVVILISVGAALTARASPQAGLIALILVTLAIAWLFSNLVYTLHYAHLFYLPDSGGKDQRGIDFPGTDEPDYWAFVYFAFTLGMTFQTSDVAIPSTRMRKVVIAHCLSAFIFNLGIIAFTINILGAGA